MGAFFDSIHVRTEDSSAIQKALEQLAHKADYKFWVGPAVRGWICVCPNEIGPKEPVSANIAMLLSNDILHLMVYDDDIFYYYFYREGKLIDQYNSDPDYFDETSEGDKQECPGQPELLQDLLPEKTSLDNVKNLLAADKFIFESQRLAEFVELFGIPNALTSYDHLDAGVDDEIDGWERFVHIEFEPESADDFNQRGEAKLAKGDADGALSDFKKAMELNPDLIMARDNCALAENARASRTKKIAESYLFLRVRPKPIKIRARLSGVSIRPLNSILNLPWPIAVAEC